MVRRKIDTEIEALLEINGRVLAEVFLEHRHVAALMGMRKADVIALLEIKRLFEKRLHDIEHPGRQRRVDAVARDLEKSRFTARRVDRAGGPGGIQARQVDDGDGRCQSRSLDASDVDGAACFRTSNAASTLSTTWNRLASSA